MILKGQSFKKKKKSPEEEKDAALGKKTTWERNLWKGRNNRETEKNKNNKTQKYNQCPVRWKNYIQFNL